MKSFVCGHKIPDSDSIVGAISLSYLKSQLGEECTPARQGEPNPETQFILDRFALPLPQLKTSFSGENLYLVDHSDLAQAPDDLSGANLLGIVDHHKLGDITTSAPLECQIRPVGCSNTVIKEMYDAKGVEVPADIAGAMACAILSDTVIFKSPTCTRDDINAAKDLARIAGIADLKALGMEMFIVKSNVRGVAPQDLLMRDYKDFMMNGKKIGVGQLEVVDLSVFDEMKDALKAAVRAHKEQGRFAVILLLTDIMKNGSQVLAYADDLAPIETAFGVHFADNEAWYDKCMSRKKQVIPPLEKIFG
ncbi:MAG: manganese-dependent inorganic pyrophosphatase [Helicobacteraceae bacterium]